MPLRQTAAADMENAIKEMKSQGVHSYILDLRNNPVNFILISFFFWSKLLFDLISISS